QRCFDQRELCVRVRARGRELDARRTRKRAGEAGGAFGGRPRPAGRDAARVAIDADPADSSGGLMGKIKVHEFMTLDGIIDAPTWSAEFGFDPKMGDAIASAMSGCRGILLGRTTFEMFEPAWSTRTAEENPGAPFFNDTMKYVVSSTLASTTWSNSSVVGPYNASTIASLKDEVGDLYVSGSATLVRALIAD